jgi:hypothetical protein
MMLKLRILSPKESGGSWIGQMVQLPGYLQRFWVVILKHMILKQPMALSTSHLLWILKLRALKIENKEECKVPPGPPPG